MENFAKYSFSPGMSLRTDTEFGDQRKVSGDRMSPNSSPVFNRSVYTDSGVYGFMCGGREVSAVHVEVVVFSETSVTEGEASSLSCQLQLAPAGLCAGLKTGKMC